MSLETPRAVARERAIAPVWGRLHALWCHSIIRATKGHPEFGTLVAQGFAERQYTSPTLFPGWCDYIITPRGKARAWELF